MTHAYNAIYVSDARKILANAFDYALNDCKIDIDEFAYLFSSSFYGNEFEIGNPYIISGMSGVDLARNIINDIYPNKVLPKPSFSFERSPYYWAGWVLAYYQWYTNKRFKEIFKRIPLKLHGSVVFVLQNTCLLLYTSDPFFSVIQTLWVASTQQS